MNLRQTELLSALVMLAFILFGFYQTTLIDLTLSSDLEVFTGPRAYPRIILGGMLLLSLALLVKACLNFKANDADDASTSPLHPRLTKIVIALIILAIFTALLEPLGYLITLVPLLIAFGYLNGATHLPRIAVFSVIAAALCLIVFRYGLNTVLPEGVLGIDQIF